MSFCFGDFGGVAINWIEVGGSKKIFKVIDKAGLGVAGWGLVRNDDV